MKTKHIQHTKEPKKAVYIVAVTEYEDPEPVRIDITAGGNVILDPCKPARATHFRSAQDARAVAQALRTAWEEAGISLGIVDLGLAVVRKKFLPAEAVTYATEGEISRILNTLRIN